MKIVKKNVYYCDYCGKKALRPLKTHEEHCVKNPHRKCRMPGCGGNDIDGMAKGIREQYRIVNIDKHDDVFGLITQTVEWIGKSVTIDDIINMTDGCPACTLAVFVQSGLSDPILGIEYDYKKHCEEFWRENNRNRNQETYY